MTNSSEVFGPVKTFAQLKPGCAIRSAKYPNLTGIFKFEGHGLAVIRLDAMNRDSLCQLKDIHAKLEAPTC
jgi:hypothetical protein